MNDINNLIPILSKDVELKRLETGEFIVQQKKLGYNVMVNENTAKILYSIDNERNIENIRRAIDIPDISEELIHDLLYNNLLRYGIIEKEGVEVHPKKRERHLMLSFIFLPADLVNHIVTYLTPIFNTRIFIFTFIFCVFFDVFIFLQYFDVYKTNLPLMYNAKVLLSMFILYIFHIFHELGHAAAGKKFGIKSKGIGFGFYWILPVFFSDMSNAWCLERGKRIVVNLGGIYFDMLTTAIWYLFFLFTFNPFFLIYPTIILINVLTNLNFFIKYGNYSGHLPHPTITN